MDLLPVFRPLLPTTAKIAPYMREIDANRYYTNLGPLVFRFEKRLAEHFGVDPATCVTAANGTVALTLLLRALNVPEGAFCAMPSWTFVATPAAALDAGLVPSFVDVDPSDWTLRPEAVRTLAQKRTLGAVIVVAPYGAPLDLAPWEAFADETGIPVIVDAAASFDSLAKRQQPTRLPVMVSLHATKTLGIGEGAVLLTGDPDLSVRVRRLGNFGFWMTRSAVLPGVNAKLNEYMSAIGLAALDAWPQTRARWAKLTMAFEDERARLAGVEAPPFASTKWVAPYGLVVFDSDIDADLVHDKLAQRGIGSVAWWSHGCHKHPAYARFPRTKLDVTERLSRSVLGLPFWLGLSSTDLRRVFTALNDVLQEDVAALPNEATA
jgi:dTDP-4-amino-4,6-dideoxygalactose transaminase